MSKSKDLTPQDAAIKIMEFTSADEITAFTDGETRRSVIKTAEARTKEIATAAPRNDKPKDGDQSGPITQKTADFKDGIQATKGADPSNPRTLDPSPPRSYVTCEDVIEKMRKAGKKI